MKVVNFMVNLILAIMLVVGGLFIGEKVCEYIIINDIKNEKIEAGYSADDVNVEIEGWVILGNATTTTTTTTSYGWLGEATATDAFSYNVWNDVAEYSSETNGSNFVLDGLLKIGEFFS